MNKCYGWTRKTLGREGYPYDLLSLELKVQEIMNDKKCKFVRSWDSIGSNEGRGFSELIYELPEGGCGILNSFYSEVNYIGVNGMVFTVTIVGLRGDSESFLYFDKRLTDLQRGLGE